MRIPQKQQTIAISFIVIAFNMERAIKRTLISLSKSYQKKASSIHYEIILIDNGSDQPLSPSCFSDITPKINYHYIHDASVSPAKAINFAAKQAKGKYLGILIDGARMVTPGLITWAERALSLSQNPLVSVLGLHLGPGIQKETTKKGYTEAVEDQLLSQINWPHDGYRLFEIASLAGSCAYGWFGAVAESNCLLLRKDFFFDLGGYDERFILPGGGLVNLDFYKKACDHHASELIYLLGEGCFHQLHGGVTTGGKTKTYTFNDLHKEYYSIHQANYQTPTKQALMFGHIPSSSAKILYDSAQSLLEKESSSHT